MYLVECIEIDELSQSGMKEHRTCSVELFCSVLFCRTQNRTEHHDKICALCGWSGKNISRHFVDTVDFADVAHFGPKGEKWTVQWDQTGRSKGRKLDGLKEHKRMFPNSKTGRSKKMKLDGPKSKNWTVWCRVGTLAERSEEKPKN